MSFGSPQQLWWLLVLPVLYWLSLPPRPKQLAFTAHWAQWQLALSVMRRRPRQWSGLRFLLLALAAAAAVMAAAGPVLRGAPGATRLVVFVDASASMAVPVPTGATAFAAATERIRQELAVVPPHVDVTLVSIGGQLRRRHGASARAAQDLGTPGGAFDVDLAALAATTATADTAVWSLTDGQGQAALPTSGALSMFDTAGPNAAIVAVRLDDAWPLPTLVVEVDVVAAMPAAQAAELRVSGAVRSGAAATLTLVPGATVTHRFELERTVAGGEVEFGLVMPGDRQAIDDRQALWLPALPAPRIAALTDDEAGPFAAVAAAALADEVGGEVVTAAAGREVGLVLVDGGRTSLQPGQERALTFGALLGDKAVAEPWPEPRAIDWDRTASLTRGLDLSDLRVQRAWRDILPPGEPFLWADDGRVPLAVVTGDQRRASVHFAFRLQDSNLPLLAAFPQLLRRAFVRSYAAGAASRPLTAPLPAGELDLLRRAEAADRPLPAFSTPDRDLAPWCVLAGLVALALRAFVR